MDSHNMVITTKSTPIDQSKPSIAERILTIRYVWGKRFKRILRIVVLILLFIFMVAPLVWLFTSAFRPVTEIFASVYPFSLRTFIPSEITLENFSKLLFSEGSWWPRYIANTVFVAVVTTIVGTIINALAAYGFARIRFPGSNILFFVVLLTIIIPFEAIALPLYTVIKGIGWINTFQALIFPALADAFCIFLLRQFFMGIPVELEEAAIVDGAGRLRIFGSIIIPLSWPALITAAIMVFQKQWQAFIWPLIVTSSQEVRVMQIAISTLIGQDAVYWNEVFAATAIAALVPIVIFLFLQRYYIQGISTTGLKG